MENFKRINKNSILEFIEKGNGIVNETPRILEEINECETERHQILQMVDMGGFFIIEKISRLEEEIATPIGNPTHDIDFENYLDTIINRDPFRGKYSNKQIKAVFEAGDREWLETALKSMKNDFIRERLQYIVDRGGYGKIKC